MTRHRVVVVGAGFAGISAVRQFANSDIEVLLLNRDNYHAFLPLLPQVAACKLEPEHIVYPIRGLLRKLPNLEFVTTEVKRIDLVSQVVETDSCLVHYDYLILACGSTSHFLRVPGASKYSFALKSLINAVKLRNHILDCFERWQSLCKGESLFTADISQRQQLLTFTIVGGGTTGVELAGELIELIRGSLVKDYPSVDMRRVRVLLLQAGEKLLPEMPAHLSDYAKCKLERMGVSVRVRSRVTQITEDAVYLEDSGVIPTQTVVWTAGVGGNRDAQEWGLPTNKNGQVTVLPTLQVAEYPQVYVIGDLAALQDRKLPMVAPVATQQGITAATNILRQIKGKNPQPLKYKHQGSMVIIGRHTAVASIGINITGFLAWLLWLFIHLAFLPGTRNRLHVLINWVWNYLLSESPVRLILPLGSASKLKSLRIFTDRDDDSINQKSEFKK
jgi:NADH dehydrogenase